MNSTQQASTAFQHDIGCYPSSSDPISSINPPQARLRVAQPRSKWVADLTERLNEITSLPPGWDGYDGCPVSFNVAQFAANLIERLCVADMPAPNLVPGSDGTLQIEWHRNQYDVEIDVLGPYRVVAYRRHQKTGVEQELDLESDFTVLAGWIDELLVEQEARSLPLQVVG